MLTLLASIRGILLIVTYLKYLFEIQIIRQHRTMSHSLLDAVRGNKVEEVVIRLELSTKFRENFHSIRRRPLMLLVLVFSITGNFVDSC